MLPMLPMLFIDAMLLNKIRTRRLRSSAMANASKKAQVEYLEWKLIQWKRN